MENTHNGPGLAFVLEPDGRIGETLRRPAECRLAAGVPFEALFDADSKYKAILFIEEVLRLGAVFAREITCLIDSHPKPHLFTGLRLDDRVLVLCALHQEELFRLFEEMTASIEIQSDVLKTSLKRLAETLAHLSDVRAAEIEELNRLNMELAELQEELRRKNDALEALNAEIRRQAETDALTGLLNRRGFFPRAERDFLRAKRYGHGFVVIMIDIDLFKAVNDRWGHVVGDQALAGFADVLKKGIRESDLLARYGGEEFILLALNGQAPRAGEAAERLRRLVETSELPTDAGPLKLTISLGVAAFESGSPSLDEVIKQADEALYEAKRNGRNRIVFHRPA